MRRRSASGTGAGVPLTEATSGLGCQASMGRSDIDDHRSISVEPGVNYGDDDEDYYDLQAWKRRSDRSHERLRDALRRG